MKTTKSLLIELGKKLDELKLTLVIAESCTGGGLAYLISAHKEVSSFLERGYVVYSNQAKEQLLDVTPDSLQTHGAVSREVAMEMAEGALKNSSAQLSIAITGIAGVDKETHSKDGTVWIAFAGILNKHHVFKMEISGTRKKFMDEVIYQAIVKLIKFLNKW